MFLSAIGSTLPPTAKEIDRIKEGVCLRGVCQKRRPLCCSRCTRWMNPCFFAKNIREVYIRVIDDIDELIEVVQLLVLFFKLLGKRVF
jgi:hypothetical protein